MNFRPQKSAPKISSPHVAANSQLPLCPIHQLARFVNELKKFSHSLVLMLATALIVVALLLRKENEIRRLRANIAALTNVPNQNLTAPTTDPLPADLEEFRRDVAEIQDLRAEVSQLRREKVDATALQARIEKLALEIAALNTSLNTVSGHTATGTRHLVVRARSLVQSSPEEAARWVAALPQGKEQEEAALAVVEGWSRTDSAAAAAWATHFTEGPLRQEALSAIAREWGLHDWKATSAWLETLPAGSSRDAAIGSFVTSADGHDIKLALEWANQMESSEARAERVEHTARRWLREDNAAARAWIEKAQLPSGLAARILSAK